MATKDKDAKPDTVEVPVTTLEALQARLAVLEQQNRVHTEVLLGGRSKILDAEYEAYKLEVAKPTPVRTQEAADRRYGTDGPRFRVYLDTTAEDGKPGPKIPEHPAIVLAANSDLEAQARYLDLCGIRKHDYRCVAESVAA